MINQVFSWCYQVLPFPIIDGIVKTLHPESRRLAYLLRHRKFNVITTYLNTLHSIKFAFLEYEVFT